MKASHSDQQAILEIQRLDDQLASLAQREATLPETTALNSVVIKRNNVRDLRIAAETERTDVKRELSRAEGDVEQIVTRIQRDEARLNSGTGTAKELEQTQHELVTLGLRRAELEEAELVIMVQVEGITNRIDELTAEESRLAAEIADLEIKRENALTIIINERTAVSEKRASIIAPIADDLKALYAKVAADNNGNGAAMLVGNECKGCRLTINTTEVGRIATLPAEEVVRCEQCRCILVRE
jgi:predicted  nucleic acid-binding Zn-ribbon protein